MAAHKKPAVKVLRPEEGSVPKVRVFNTHAVNNRTKGMSSTMGNYFDYSKGNAAYDPVPKGRFTDSRGAACAAAGRRTEMDKVLDPGKDPYTEPQPNPRAGTSESRANLERGRGSLHVIGGGPSGPAPTDYAPPTRCQTASAVENMQRSRSGVMSTVMVHSRDYTDPQRPLRGDTKAAVNAERSRGSVMAATLEQRPGFVAERPRPRCPSPQAMEQRERARGCMDRLMAGALPGDPCPRPRLGHGAGANADREGSGMAQTFAGSGKPPVEAAPAPRVKPEAQHNANKNRGTLTQQQYDYRTGPGPTDEPQPLGRTRPGRGAENMKNSSGVVTKNLMCMYGKLPSDIQPKPRVQPRGRKIARMSSGSQVSALISPPKPRRVRRRPRSCTH